MDAKISRDKFDTFEPWQKRVVYEYEELISRIERLADFLGQALLPPMEETTLILMRHQLSAMSLYALMLKMRIAEWI